MKNIFIIILLALSSICHSQIIWQRCDEGGVPDCDGSTVPAKGRHDLQPQAPFLTVQELVDNFGTLMRPAPGFGFVEFTGWWFSDTELGIYYLNNGGGLWSMGHDCGGALPITLVSFNGEAIGNKITIEWVVASQVNNDYFEIQKSLNLDKWDLVDSVTGAGTTNRQMSYSIVDYNSNIGYTYYRLKQVDHNGESETFYPIAIQVKSERKHIIKTINLQGNEIDSTSKGLMIHIWDNGTVTKVMK
jgi:hypothetical protein